MFTTYILYSSNSNLFYTGHTSDLQRRLIEHNRGKTNFMKRGIPWVVVFSAIFSSKAEAMALESSIKKRGAKRFLSDYNILPL
jgi:putative endonuclease